MCLDSLILSCCPCETLRSLGLRLMGQVGAKAELRVDAAVGWGFKWNQVIQLLQCAQACPDSQKLPAAGT